MDRIAQMIFIAEVMELAKQNRGDGSYLYESPATGEYVPAEDLDFDVDWNALMALVTYLEEKVFIIGDNEFSIDISIEYGSCQIYDGEREGFVDFYADSPDQSDKKGATYKAVLQFMLWVQEQFTSYKNDVIVISGSHGSIVVNKADGTVLNYENPQGEYRQIVFVNLEEQKQFWNLPSIPDYGDILDFGYLSVFHGYVQPAQDWRELIKEMRNE